MRKGFSTTLLVSHVLLFGPLYAEMEDIFIPRHGATSFYGEFEGGWAFVERDLLTGAIITISPRAMISVFPPLATEEEARALAAAFIDGHPALFLAKSASFHPLHVHDSGESWSILASQRHDGIIVLGGFFDLEVMKDGHLAWLHARIFPAADLEGVELEPDLSAEEATAIAIAAQKGGPRVSMKPRQVIAFRSGEPVLAWEVWVGEPSAWTGEPVPRWRYTVAADTGQILRVQDEVTHVDPVDLHGKVTGHGTDPESLLPDGAE